MQKYNYNWEIKDILTQFLQAFDGAIVKRKDKDGNIGNVVAVRYVYAPKQRVLHDLINKAQHITLPVVAFWISGIKRDPERVFNKIEGSYYNKSFYDSRSEHSLQPIPVDIDVTVSILARFQSDIDQIVSNFVPYCDPYFVLSWTVEGTPNIEIRSPVIWDNNLNFEYFTEQTATNATRVGCETTFTIKSWLFKNRADPVGRIYKIDANFYAVSGTPTSYNIDSLVSPSNTESFVVSAIPQIINSNRWLTPIDFAGTVILEGVELDTVTQVYLSGADGMFPVTTTVNFFSGGPLSATYPALTGLTPVTTFKKGSLIVNYPAPRSGGYFDIIVFNAAGYSKMTQTVYNVNYSQQFPYVNGIEVVGTFNYTWETAIITWDAATFEWRVA